MQQRFLLLLAIFSGSFLSVLETTQNKVSQNTSCELWAINYSIFFQVSGSSRKVFFTEVENIEKSETGTLTDSRDHSTYQTVKIGEQWWMAENLAYLPFVSPSLIEAYDNSYCYIYGYQDTCIRKAKATYNFDTYGVLYNWKAAIDACPEGWHLPSDEEWKQLEMYLGMNYREVDGTGWRGTDEGWKLKSEANWYNNGNGNNESGFSALPGGYRYHDGRFYACGDGGIWWSATEGGSLRAWYRTLEYDKQNVHRHLTNKENGFSIRCLRDN